MAVRVRDANVDRRHVVCVSIKMGRGSVLPIKVFNEGGMRWGVTHS